jgi:phage terminase large subunit
MNLQNKIQENPGWFVREFLGDELWEKQEEILSSVFKNPKTTARSCHASGKSFDAARVALAFLFAYKNSIVLSTAPTWRQVEDVIWKEIRAAHGRAKYDLGGAILNTRYNLAPDWFAVGLSTDDPDKFQGYHAPHILMIIDESSGVLPAIFEAIEGIGSTGHVRILELGNPTDPTGHFAQTFKSEFYSKIHISCFDTPNFKSIPDIESLKASSQEERLGAVTHPFLITPQWVYERLMEWGEDSPMFQARCLGEFPVEGEDTLIPLRLALKAVESTNLGDQSIERLGVDIARFGSDKTVLAYRQGNKVVELLRYAKEDTMQTVGRVVQFHRVHPYSLVKDDDAGVGGGVTDRLREMGVPIDPINVGSAAHDPEKFLNLRAELYWSMKMRFEAGDIIIPDDDQLVSELTSIKYKLNSRGQIVLESKEDMKKRGLHSPDSADAVCLAFAPDVHNAFIEFYKEQS